MIGPLAHLTVVVVDVETTGWLRDRAELTEIGAVRLSAGERAGEFCTLVRPARPIPPDIITLTGITEAMVSHAPPAPVALRAFLAFAGDCVLVAHNASFDLGFLRSASDACGIAWPRFPVLDTSTLARLLLGDSQVPDCRLATLAAYFSAKTAPSHRALADARATADVLTGLLQLAARDGRTGQPALTRLAS